MNAKGIRKALDYKIGNWIDSIEDKTIAEVVRKNVMVTGGAIVSMLLNEPVNDYDVYFKTLDSCQIVADYYMNLWNKSHSESREQVRFDFSCEDRVRLIIGPGRGRGMVAESGDDGVDDDTEPFATENQDDPTKENPAIQKPKYRPRFFSTNAISLSDQIQLVIRFSGPIESIHKNFDFEHTKCVYDYYTNTLVLPPKSLECILAKELVYRGSKYPLTSIIRTRKFIMRGWKINAGQYVKMALDLNQLDLLNLETFKDQVVGVDSAYFMQAVEAIAAQKEKDPTFELTDPYLFEVIDRIF